MPEAGKENDILHIKKYPNRRFYDTTRSCHVTLHDIHDLIQRGNQVRITDSRDGSDITNLILLQILLDKDHLKLDIFPPTILHLMLRSNHQALRSYMEHFFGPYLNMIAASQKQFDGFLQQTAGTNLSTPMDWANSMFNAMTGMPSPPATSPHTDNQPPEPTDPSPDDVEAGESLRDLRKEVAELHERIASITAKHENV